MNKDLIKQRFGRSFSMYDQNADVQRQMAEKLISFLENKSYKNVLEIGCGTGLLTRIANCNLDFQKYIANDIVEKSSEYIKKINKNIQFVPADVEEYLINTEEKFDLIISNASLQWIDDFSFFCSKVINKLNTNGIFLFSTFGKENFREINFVMNKTLKYYSKNDYKNFFPNLTVEFEEEVRIKYFKTPKDVLKHIQKTGVNAITSETWTKKDLFNFENGYNNFCSSHPTLTYNPIYIKVTNRLVG